MTDKEQSDPDLKTQQVIPASPCWWLISPASDKQGDFNMTPVIGWLLNSNSQSRGEKTAIGFAQESTPESFVIFAPDFNPSSYLSLVDRVQNFGASAKELKELLLEANVICTIN